MSNSNTTYTICIAVAIMLVLVSVFIYLDFGKTIKCYEGCISSYKSCKLTGISENICADQESHCKNNCFNKKSIL